MKNQYKLILFIVFSNLFLVKPSFSQKYKLDNNFEGAVYVFGGVGFASANLKNYSEWLSTKNLATGQGSYLPMHVGLMAISRKKIMFGIEFSTDNRIKLDKEARIPYSFIVAMGRIGYNFLTINRLNLYFMGGIGYRRTEIDWVNNPPANFVKPYINDYYAITRQNVMVASPELGLNYIIPIDVDEGVLIRLAVGLNLNIINGDSRYADYKKKNITYDKNNPRRILVTPEIPNSLSGMFYVNLSLGYFLSW